MREEETEKGGGGGKSSVQGVLMGGGVETERNGRKRPRPSVRCVPAFLPLSFTSFLPPSLYLSLCLRVSVRVPTYQRGSGARAPEGRETEILPHSLALYDYPLANCDTGGAVRVKYTKRAICWLPV